MKLHWIAAPVCLLIGLLMGRMGGAADQSVEAGVREGPRQRERQRDERESPRSSAYGSLRSDIRKAPSDKMAGMMKRALTQPDLFERRALINECFQGMDAGNWHEVFAMFAQVTKETGMTQDFEWKMALMMAGRTGTRDAAEWFRKNAGGDQLKEAVWGWSQVDPAAARGWLDEVSAEDPKLRGQLLAVVLGGAVRCNGVAAMKMLEEIPLAERAGCVGDFGWNLVQRDGLDAAVEWAVQTKAKGAGVDDAYVQQVANQVVGQIFRGAKDVGGGREAAGRVARLIEADPAQNRHIAKFVSGLPSGQPFEFLSEISKRPVAAGEDMQALIHSQLSSLAQSRPEVAAQWLQSHPQDPLATAVRDLIQ